MNDDNYDDDQERDQEDGEWVPPPPPDDDDEREDPNPRAAVDEPVRTLPPRPMSEKQAQEHRAGVLIGEVIALVGMKGALGAILDAAERNDPVIATKTCPVCGEESPMVFSALIGGSMRHQAECGRCQGNRNRRSVERVEVLVRDLKQLAEAGDADPSREREIIKQLREYDHPDIDGLERHCRGLKDKANRSGGAPKKGPKGYGW